MTNEFGAYDASELMPMDVELAFPCPGCGERGLECSPHPRQSGFIVYCAACGEWESSVHPTAQEAIDATDADSIRNWTR